MCLGRLASLAHPGSSARVGVSIILQLNVTKPYTTSSRRMLHAKPTKITGVGGIVMVVVDTTSSVLLRRGGRGNCHDAVRLHDVALDQVSPREKRRAKEGVHAVQFRLDHP